MKPPYNRTGVNQNETLLPIAVGFFCKTPVDLVFARIAMAVDTDVFSTSCCFHAESEIQRMILVLVKGGREYIWGPQTKARTIPGFFLPIE